MVPEMRRQRIVQLTRERGVVSVTELKELLGASEATLRRDLTRLASQGMVRRVRGGATAIEGLDQALAWSSAKDRHLKVRIGQRAAKLVKPRMTVSLENGGTAFEVARCLLKVPDIRVITNSLHIAYLLNLHGKCKAVELTGGTLRQDTYLFGPFTSLILSQFTVDIAFVGALAFSVEQGITEPEPMATEIKKAFIRHAHRAVLVADHTKSGRVATMAVAPLSALDTLVTTREIASQTAEAIRNEGVQVITC